MKTYLFLIKLFLFSLLIAHTTLQAQSALIKVQVAPDHSDWTYRPNEKVKFNVTVTKNNIPISNITIRYEVGPEMMAPIKNEQLTLKSGTGTIDGGTMKEPGFLRCKVVTTYEGRDYIGLATAAFSPKKIQPTAVEPNDFMDFWNKAKAEAAEIPLDTQMRLMPELCTGKTNAYEVSVQNSKNGSRLYGILCIPKAAGKHPAILKVPGAGVRPYFGDRGNADKGFITFEIGIHGIPVTMDESVYRDLRTGAIRDYPSYNLDDKDRYYFKRVYLGLVRAVDLIYSLPEFDGENIGVFGGSQGGALAIITAALDSRIKSLVSFYPALCDMTGYLHGRAGGWPHMFNKKNLSYNNTPEKIATIQYYDVVNFARHVKVPGFYSWGFNDETCPPTSMYSAYNVVTAPKTIYIVEETGHGDYPEQWDKAFKFLHEQLKK